MERKLLLFTLPLFLISCVSAPKTKKSVSASLHPTNGLPAKLSRDKSTQPGGCISAMPGLTRWSMRLC